MCCSRLRRFCHLIGLTCIALILAGCGGGGGGGGGGGSVVASFISPRPEGTYEEQRAAYAASSEYQPSYIIDSPDSACTATSPCTDSHLARINAAVAYADGWTGRGQTIAMVDSGFSESHRELAGKTAGKVSMPDDYIPRGNQLLHGTATASVAAGARAGPASSGLDMHGVAFDARLHYTQIRLGASDGIFRPFRLENYSSADDRGDARFYSEILEAGRSAGARILNLSFGLSGSIATYDRAEVRSRFATTASIFAQTHTYDSAGLRVSLTRPDADKSIFVWSAGNLGSQTDPATGAAPNHATPTVLGGLGLYFPELQSHHLAVVALDQDGTIASYSNRCGSAAAFCIAAPGSRILVAYYEDDSEYFPLDGTSFAAPIVSGALAVLAQRFPTIGTDELVTRIKMSADKTGIYADTARYGQGLLDLGAAIAPIGTMTLGAAPLASSSFTPGGAFGDALEGSGQSVTGFDSLNAPFEYALTGFIRRPDVSTLQPLQTMHEGLYNRRIQSPAHSGPTDYFTGAGGFGLRNGGGGINADATSHLYLSHGGAGLPITGGERLAVSALFAADTDQYEDELRVAGLQFAWSPRKQADRHRFAFSGGYVNEFNEALQSTGEGAFGGLSAETFFLAAAGGGEINRWRLTAGAELGVALVHGDHLFDDLSPLLTSAFSLGASRRFYKRDEIHFGLSSPLRVESGRANLTLPVGRTRSGAVQYTEINPSLSPSGRQVDLTATWQRRLPAGYLTLSTRASRHPNHRAGVAAEFAALASYRLDF